MVLISLIKIEVRSKLTIERISAIKEGLDAVGIKQTDITDRKIFRYNVFDKKLLQREKRKKTGSKVWSDSSKIAY